jgi:hypothetical protein
MARCRLVVMEPDVRAPSEAPAPPTAMTALTREVLAPQHSHGGLGVMIVAAAAMFFAVASSAFILQARMSRHWRHRTPVRMSRPMAAPLPTPPVEECGRASFRDNPDGTISVYFNLCPTPDGVEVRRIVNE